MDQTYDTFQPDIFEPYKNFQQTRRTQQQPPQRQNLELPKNTNPKH